MACLKFLVLFFLFINLSYSQKDTIFQGQHLRVGEKLESANKEFRLEFFSLDGNKTHYIGIFYNLPSNMTLYPDDYRPVWVANRNIPIQYASGNNLTLDDDGKLKIVYGRDSFVMLSFYNATTRNASATLFDNGNFVLVELNTNGSANKTLWQSFDYPTDTLLPGMKLGRNVKTGQIWSLTSWISKDIPASGSFTIGVDTNDIDQLIMWWMGSVFWTSGRWGNGTFGNVSRVSHYHYSGVSFVSTEDEKYLTYSVNETRTLSRYVIDTFGFIKERGAAGPFGVCFYKSSPGCVTEESIFSIRNDSWFKRSLNSVSGDRFRFGNNNMSLFDCKRQCKNNCSIAATGTGCEILSNVSILNSLSGSDVFILDAAKVEFPVINQSTRNGAPYITVPPGPSPNAPSGSNNGTVVVTNQSTPNSVPYITVPPGPSPNAPSGSNNRTEDEKYLTYSVNETRTLSRYAIHTFGFIKERGAAGPFGVCFYKSSPGCVTEESIGSSIRNDSWFKRRLNSVSGDRFRFGNNSMSLFDCKGQCENNCSITATGTGGEIWSNVSISNSLNGSDVFILDAERDLVPPPNVPSRISPPPVLAPAPSPNSTSGSSKGTSTSTPPRAIKWWIWLIAATGLTLFVGVSSLCYFLHGKGKTKTTALLLLSQTANGSKKRKLDKKMSHEVQLYSLESLAIATDNFSPGNKLGEGGFGPVYKGKLPDGQEVAIKRLSTSSGQGLVEFKNEILLIAKLQHTNLVRLLGYCTQREERILVYEYMHNKSLDFFLFDSNKKELLNWNARFRIIEGIAQGLLYLHKYSRLKVIHRDLKSGNILLDADMNPKISDFGMARIFGTQESEANTKRIVGTRGYMSPEYALRGIVSTKTDVFSFGVLLLEIVSGKKNNNCYDSEHPLNLIGLAWELWREERALELIDTTLIESCSRDEVMRCIHVGLLCVQDYAKDRPSMSNVVSMLMNDTKQPPPPPQRPGFFIERGDQRAEISEEVVRYSINGLSITELKAR